MGSERALSQRTNSYFGAIFWENLSEIALIAGIALSFTCSLICDLEIESGSLNFHLPKPYEVKSKTNLLQQ